MARLYLMHSHTFGIQAFLPNRITASYVSSRSALATVSHSPLSINFISESISAKFYRFWFWYAEGCRRQIKSNAKHKENNNGANAQALVLSKMRVKAARQPWQKRHSCVCACVRVCSTRKDESRRLKRVLYPTHVVVFEQSMRYSHCSHIHHCARSMALTNILYMRQTLSTLCKCLFLIAHYFCRHLSESLRLHKTNSRMHR